MKINANNYPNLFNLLTLSNVIDPNTTVYDEDSDTNINLCDLLTKAWKDLEESGVV